jgi:shikimate kinase
VRKRSAARQPGTRGRDARRTSSRPLSINRDMETSASHLVLIGMMGAGKTTVGRLVAARLGWAFWDNDEALLKATGKSAAQMQTENGQFALHKIEDHLLREALCEQAATVYAAAGSVVVYPETLAGVATIWLRISAARDELNIARSGQHHRPLPADAAATLERLGKAREAQYARLADAVVDAASTPDVTCERVLEALSYLLPKALPRRKPPISPE